MRMIFVFLFWAVIASTASADCNAATQKIAAPVEKLDKQVDERCRIVPTVPIPKLMPLISRFEEIYRNPGSLRGKLPRNMDRIVSKIKKVYRTICHINNALPVMSRSSSLDFCNENDQKAFFRDVEKNTLIYALPVKVTYEKYCNDYAEWIRSPPGVNFIRDISNLITKTMA